MSQNTDLLIQDDKASGQIRVSAQAYRLTVDLNTLVATIHGGDAHFDFALAGCLSYCRSASPGGDLLHDAAYREASHAVAGSDIIISAVDVHSSARKTITLACRPDTFTYSLALCSPEEWLIHDVCLGAAVDASGEQADSRSSFEEFFIWCPDRYQSTLPFNQTVELRLSTTRMPDEGFFRGDVGKYLVPPYIAALRQGHSWAGIATMEIPSSQLGLHIFVTRQGYHAGFRYSGNLKARQGVETRFPVLGFFFAPRRDDVLRRYIASIYESGLAERPSTWAGWWAGPMYCTYADQVYQHTIDSGIMKDEPGATANCNERFVSERLAIMDDHRIPYGIVTLDYGWLDCLGDHEPDPQRFPDLRAFIDGLHARGKHVLLWFAPFFCESGSRLAQEHPDWMVHNRDGSLNSHTWMKKTIYTPDFTHPDVRGTFTRLIGRLLGSGPGQWNADGFKIDGYSFLPDVDNVYHDPEWGTGDRFQYRADKLIYNAAKATKADALVEQSFANPLFNDTQDVCRLDDASSYDTDLYENRAWVALLVGAAVPDTDDWSAFKKMFVHSTLRKSVYGIPTLYAVKYRGAGRMGGASGGYPVPIAEEDYSRVSAILRVYQHAPIDATQERFVDPDNKVFWRKYTQGPLAGFYAATTLAGNTALATYQPGLIQLAAIVETQAAVPLPPGCKVESVKEILSSGPARTPRYCLCDDAILLWMQPSVGPVDHYEIELIPDRKARPEESVS